ncbi:VRR-NUC domain-containing protein [Patescibacteria group bacterium]|nr:VRR-NUC domain-containing protein [Patescibacteria group bacterium]
MPRRLEASIENAVVRWARSRGLVCIKMNPQGMKGLPDRLFLLPGGNPFFLELKRPGEKPRPTQVFWHDLLRRLGYAVAVADSTRTAIDAVVRANGRSSEAMDPTPLPDGRDAVDPGQSPRGRTRRSRER